ncbi:SRPBCC family protein [Actinacidiphila acidipaludis]|uniref:SRPBCC domain-containing protein n=1 Tax=Actinacidiphila acidipaludis TaxID=2873382 RepID=A0ABS7Q645_9ACTN|nr:SRPBCC domain-containing protein [Streptomyces acidipaludis]MBY8877905.1 SRPBCC domain-containing protein [Streptomyces acidipaludis]
MPEPFEIVREFEVEASPEEVWDAVTTGTAGWLWPMEYEPREGGAGPYGSTVTAWDPPHRFTGRTEAPEGAGAEGGPRQTLNQLDHLIEPREGGGAWVRYVHSGIIVDDWDNQYDGASRHTDFYLHTLRQYLVHFRGRSAVYSGADSAGAAAGAPDALDRAARALGLDGTAAEGDTVQVRLPGADAPAEAVLDYRNRYFIGLRTADAMYRLFGRNHFGATVGVSVHDFAADADAAGTGKRWQDWLDAVYT